MHLLSYQYSGPCIIEWLIFAICNSHFGSKDVGAKVDCIVMISRDMAFRQVYKLHNFFKNYYKVNIQLELICRKFYFQNSSWQFKLNLFLIILKPFIPCGSIVQKLHKSTILTTIVGYLFALLAKRFSASWSRHQWLHINIFGSLYKIKEYIQS